MSQRRLLIRVGAIGDFITGVSAANVLDADLLHLKNKKYLKFNILDDAKLLCLAQKLHFPISKLKSLSSALSQDYEEIYLFPQSLNLGTHLFRILLSLIFRKKVQLHWEGNAWFLSTIEHQRNNFIGLLKEQLKQKIGNKHLVIIWDGKESQKYLNTETIRKIITNFKNDYVIELSGGANSFNIEGIHNFGGEPLSNLLNRIDNADLVISADTGPMHYAAFKGKMVITITSHRYPLAYWHPFLPNVCLISDINMFCKMTCKNCQNNICVNGATTWQWLDKMSS